MTPQRLIMLIFFLQPLAYGSWLPRIPDIQAALGLSPAQLAIALLGLPVGTLCTLPFAGRIAARIGAKTTILLGFCIFTLAAPLPVWSTSMEMLFVTLIVTGSSLSFLELGLNVKADQIESQGGRLIMSTCHGFWSLGIMAGSMIGSGMLALHVPPNLAVSLTSVALLPVALLVAIRLPDVEPAHPVAEGGKAGFKPPSLALLGVCFFVFGVTMTEGAMADWSAIFLREVFAAAPQTAGLGYSVFALMVALGRFGGDYLKARLGAVTLARICGTLSLAGIVVVWLAPGVAIAFAGFALIGIGVSVAFPLAVTAAAGIGDRPASANVAILSFIALTGFLVGPPMIGLVAEHSDMRQGLATLLPALVASLLLAGMLRSKSPA